MSSAVTMRVNGASTVIASLGKVNTALISKIKKTVKADAKACFDKSQDDCPVGKSSADVTVSHGSRKYTVHRHEGGSLKGSGKLTVTQNTKAFYEVVVKYGGESSTGATVNYQWYVELGTCKMRAQPYLYPAFLYGSRLLSADLQGIASMSMSDV